MELRIQQKIGRAIKKRYPNCLISFGGPQVNKKPKEQQLFEKNPYIDSISLGEGERNFSLLLEDYLKGEVKQIYSFDRLQELDFPSPYGLGLFDRMIKENPTYNWNVY